MSKGRILQQGNYYGSIEKKVHTGGVLLTLSSYTQHTRLPGHFHENSYLSYVTAGSYREQSLSRQLHCEQGELIYHPAGAEHSNDFPQCGAVCFNIELDAAWTKRIPEAPLPLGRISKQKSAALSLLLNRLQTEFHAYNAWSGLMIEGLTMECLALFLRQETEPGASPRWLRMVQEILHARFREHLSLQELAAAAQVTPFHLVHAFRKAFGTSIGMYVARLRVNHACELLRQSTMPLSHIALECNFADQSHFGRAFKKITGITPLQYRKTAIS